MPRTSRGYWPAWYVAHGCEDARHDGSGNHELLRGVWILGFILIATIVVAAVLPLLRK